MDIVCKSMLETMEGGGVSVEVEHRADGVTVTARTPAGHTRVVHVDDLCAAVTQAGVELDDG